MKNVFLTALICCVGFYAWHQWQKPAPTPEIVYVTPAPTPMPPPAKPTPTPDRRTLYPEGTFALLDYASVPTKKGVYGFEPGQMVYFVSANQERHTLIVTDGTQQVEVRPEQVTNDQGIALLVRNRDQATQGALFAAQEAARKQGEAVQKEAAMAAAKSMEANRHSSSGVGFGSALNQGPQASGVRDSAINQRIRTAPYVIGGNPYSYLYNQNGVRP